MQPTKSAARKTCNQLKFNCVGKAVRRGVFGFGGAVALAATPAPAEPYTFESLTPNTFIHGNDWYRTQLHIDFTANDGEGSATLKFRNLTDGDTVFHSVSGMRDKPLGLLSMHPQAVPNRWNAMWLHLLTMGGRNPRADNLIPNVNAVRVDDITPDGTNLILTWQGGVGPYQVQSCPDPGTESWNDFGLPTDATNATVPVTTGCGFYRVTKP